MYDNRISEISSNDYMHITAKQNAQKISLDKKKQSNDKNKKRKKNKNKHFDLDSTIDIKC